MKFDPFGFADRQISKKEKVKSLDIVAAVRDAYFCNDVHSRRHSLTMVSMAPSRQ